MWSNAIRQFEGRRQVSFKQNITARNWIIVLNYDDNWRNWRFLHLFTPLLAARSLIGFSEVHDFYNELITPHWSESQSKFEFGSRENSRVFLGYCDGEKLNKKLR